MATTITDYKHAWRYAMQNGFVTKPGYPGWIVSAQRDMATIEHLIARMAGGAYPCVAHTRFYRDEIAGRFPWLSTIIVWGKHGKVCCDLKDWHDPTPENTAQAPIRMWGSGQLLRDYLEEQEPSHG